MGRIRLPGALLRALFPRRKSAASSARARSDAGEDGGAAAAAGIAPPGCAPGPSDEEEEEVEEEEEEEEEDDEEAERRREEARRRAAARRRRVLSNASSRLDAISNTSLEGIAEATRGLGQGGAQAAAAAGATSVSDSPETLRSHRPCIERNPSPPPPPPETRAGELLAQEGATKEGGEASRPVAGAVIEFFVLLLCPTSRVFEVIEIAADDAPYNRSTISDVLGFIPRKATDKRLLRRQYTGLARPRDKATFDNPRAGAFGDGDGDGPAVRDGDVLVAVLDGRSGRHMCALAAPILRNRAFRDMMRRRERDRRRRGGGREEDGDDGEESRRSRGSRGRRRRRGEAVDRGVPGGTDALVTHHGGGDDRYSALRHKLEHLSEKLNQVDDEIVLEDPTGVGNLRNLAEEVPAGAGNASFEMAPEMVANEITSNIRDVFAQHHVEVVAVDAAPAPDGDDDDTFVTARSRRSTRSTRSTLSRAGGRRTPAIEDEMPLLEITTKKKRRRRRRPRGDSRGSLEFDLGEKDDVMLQIEAMARQADAAFKNRRGDSAGDGLVAGTTIIEGTVEGPDEGMDATAGRDESREARKEAHQASVTFGDALDPGCDDGVAGPAADWGEHPDAGALVTLNAPPQLFLDAAAAIVGPEGSVCEVHALQYLGVPIVCIAANLMQQQQRQGARQGSHPDFTGWAGAQRDPFGMKEVFQSAMFLAFMVNGQRYLAKVTQK